MGKRPEGGDEKNNDEELKQLLAKYNIKLQDLDEMEWNDIIKKLKEAGMTDEEIAWIENYDDESDHERDRIEQDMLAKYGLTESDVNDEKNNDEELKQLL